MSYYIYENWRAEQKAKIHIGTCKHCNNGNGQNKEKTNLNGKWHGPYSSIEDALGVAHSLPRNVSFCGICCPQKP